MKWTCAVQKQSAWQSGIKKNAHEVEKEIEKESYVFH